MIKTILFILIVITVVIIFFRFQRDYKLNHLDLRDPPNKVEKVLREMVSLLEQEKFSNFLFNHDGLLVVNNNKIFIVKRINQVEYIYKFYPVFSNTKIINLKKLIELLYFLKRNHIGGPYQVAQEYIFSYREELTADSESIDGHRSIVLVDDEKKLQNYLTDNLIKIYDRKNHIILYGY